MPLQCDVDCYYVIYVICVYVCTCRFVGVNCAGDGINNWLACSHCRARRFDKARSLFTLPSDLVSP